MEKRTILILSYRNQFAIEQRPSQGLLASMYQFPNREGHLSLEEIKLQFPNAISIKKLPRSKHLFSHIEWSMIGYHLELDTPLETYQFVSQDDIEHRYSIPTAFKTYKHFVLGGTLYE